MASGSITKVLVDRVESFATNVLSTHPLMRRALNGKVAPQAVALFLVGMRHLLQESSSHLLRAQRRATQIGEQPLAEFFLQKQREEAGHEQWADADLEKLTRTFRIAVPAVPKAMQDYVSYLGRTSESEPAKYLVYVFFAELFTVRAGGAWVRALTDKCGVPEAALTVMSRHVELDVHHVADGIRELDNLLNGRHESKPLLEFLDSVMCGLEQFFDEVNAVRPTQELVVG